MDIGKEIKFYQTTAGKHKARLVAVSKTKPSELVLEAYNAGQRIFGENKAQELKEKAINLPDDIEWHMIGHLQTNKVKYVAPYVSLIHSVDSIKLLTEINKQASKNERIIDVLLQIYIAEEDSKFGIKVSQLNDFIIETIKKSFTNVRIVGLMGMATNTDNDTSIYNEFSALEKTFKDTKNKFTEELPYFTELSTGMSSDYQIALQTSSTMIRIGSSIFGKRDINI